MKEEKNFFSFASDFLRFVVIIIHFSFRHPRSEKKQQISTVCKKVVVAVKRGMSGRKLCAIDKVPFLIMQQPLWGEEESRESIQNDMWKC